MRINSNMLGLVLCAILTTACTDPIGPGQKKCENPAATNFGGALPCNIPAQITVKITSGGGTVTVVGNGPASVSLVGIITGAGADKARWYLGSTVVASGTLTPTLSLPPGNHTVYLRAEGSSAEDFTSVTVTSVVATLSVLTPDTSVTQIAWPTARAVFDASFNGNAAEVKWTVNGAQKGTGLRLVLDVGAGEYEVCAHYDAITVCRKLVVTRVPMTVDVYVARANGASERPVLGVQACYNPLIANKECVDVAADGRLMVKPSFWDQVTSLRLEFSGPNILPFLLDIPAEQFFSRKGVVLLERMWNGVSLSLIPAYEKSAPEPWPSYFIQSMVNGTAIYNLQVPEEDAEIKVFLAGAYNDPQTGEKFLDFSSADSARIWAELRHVESALGSVKLVPVSGTGWDGCNSIFIRRRAQDNLSSNAGHCAVAGKLVGGTVYISWPAFNNGLRRAVTHEIGGHVLGLTYHTCTFRSALYYCEEASKEANDLTSEDVSLIQAMRRTVGLMRRHEAIGWVETLQGERRARDPSYVVEKYTALY